ncbi:hypothetical protein BD410DRAFT_103290 [Rickenella mellea]|uniref:Uncharacterized protein n=1 Tax=Rickenella mellea TaxID=50990 RepID=A0A4Y7PKU8_9AGAM|nr:hypothetical protein BD410DRAFT_103290 [Rickenella mellea]
MPSVASTPSSSFDADDIDFFNGLGSTVLPGDQPEDVVQTTTNDATALKRRRSPSLGPSPNREDRGAQQRAPTFTTAGGDYTDNHTYGASRFGEYGEYMARKRAKLQIQNAELDDSNGLSDSKPQIFKGLAIYVSYLSC